MTVQETGGGDAAAAGWPRRWWVFPLAGLVAVLATLVAPETWPEGEGRLEVVLRGEEVLGEPVDVGPASAWESASASEVGVSAPNGFPVDGPVEVVVEVPPSVGAQLGDVAVTLVLPDAAREVIPVLRSDASVFTAVRRPPVGASVVLAVLGAVIVLWVSEAVPLFVTSLAIPVVLSAAGVGSAREALSPFFDPIIVLFFAGFLMAQAMHRSGLDRRAATAITAWAGRGAVTLFWTLLVTSAFLSMWMSNTAAVTVLLPIGLAVTEPLGSRAYVRSTVLGIAYAATIGGVGSAIGTPANPLAITFIEELTGRTITFAGWFALGLPMVIVFLPIMGVYLWWRGGVSVDRGRFVEAASAARRHLAELGGMRRDEVEVLVVFGGVMAVWLTEAWHGLDTGIVALGGALVLFVIGRIVPADLGRISWPTLLTFGGGLTLGTFMVSSGTADWIVSRLGWLSSWPNAAALLGVAVIALALTTVASNTAAAAMLIPLAIPLAGLIGMDPVVLVVVVAVASSVDFALVIGTPPTMLAYGTGMFTAGQILRTGGVLDLIGVALLVAIVVPFWQLIGVV